MTSTRARMSVLLTALMTVLLLAIPESAHAAVPTVLNTTLTAGTNPIDIAVTSDGAMAYVANYTSGDVSVINLRTGVTGDPIAVGNTPTSIAIAPQGGFAYVTNYNDPGNAAGSSVSRIELSSGAVTTITHSSIAGPRAVVFSPDGTRAYVSNQGSAGTPGTRISVIQTSDNSVSSITVPTAPQMLAISPDGKTLYVSHTRTSSTGAVSIITNLDTTPVVTTPITSLNLPQGMTLVGPTGSQTLYVAERGANRVGVYNATTGAPIATISGFSTPESLTLTPDGTQIFVPNRGVSPGQVKIIDVSSNTIISPTLTVGSLPYEVAFAPNGIDAYVANLGSNDVSVITFGQSRTLEFATTSYTVPFGQTQTVVATPSAGSGVGTLSYSAGSSTACSVNSNGVVSVTSGTGTCEISATITSGGTTAGSAYVAAATSTSVTITPQALAIDVTAENQTIQIGSSVASTFSITNGALSGSDAISGVTYTYEGTGATSYAASTTAPSAAGTYSVTPSAAVFSSGSSSNYSITYDPGSLTITPAVAAIVITAGTHTTQAGSSVVSTFSITSGALSGTDAISGVTYTYEGTDATLSPASTTAPTVAGTYSVTPSAAVFSSGSSADYSITYVDGTLTITKPEEQALARTGFDAPFVGLLVAALIATGVSLITVALRRK